MFSFWNEGEKMLFALHLGDAYMWWKFKWHRLQTDGDDFFTSYDEVYDSFDAMGLQENLLRGIYAYGM